MKPVVTAVIANMDRKDLLRKCLESVFSQDYPCLEAIVCDNGSKDGSVEMVRKEFPQAAVIANDTNIGAAEARNQGVRKARGKYFWFLDNDSVCPDRTVLARMVEFMEANPRAGSVGGELLSSAEGKRLVKGFNVKPNGEAVRTVFPDDGPHECDYFDTLNLLCSRIAFLAAGGFDADYVYLAEDKDLCFKIRKAGYSNVISADFGVIHLRSEENRPRSARYMRLLNRNRLRYVVLNCGWEQIALIPAYDFGPFFKPRKFLIEGSDLFFKKLSSQIYAYAWNLVRIPFTVAKRYNPSRFK